MTNTIQWQKQNRLIIWLSLSLLLGSCNSKPQETNLSVYRSLYSSLRQSNYMLTVEVMRLQKEFERDTSDLNTSYFANIWQPKALKIQATTNRILEYLDSLKTNLKIEAGLKLIDMAEHWEEKDFKAVDIFFQRKGKGEELNQRIKQYKIEVLAIDQKMDSIFKPSVAKTILVTDIRLHEQKSFTEVFFSNIPAIAALAVLEKFENDIRLLEFQLITFCYLQIPR